MAMDDGRIIGLDWIGGACMMGDFFFYKSANADHERSMLIKLKQQCGGRQFTSKLESMVKCVEVFKEFYRTCMDIPAGNMLASLSQKLWS